MEVKTGAGGPFAFMKEEPLMTNCNEWFLLHGTSEQNAKLICENDFKQGKVAGTATGTLYGAGTYFAESSTKADEYAKATEADPEIFTMLMCRVVGGRVKYTDEVEPKTEELVNACINGSYDSVVGDREKCRGTFKEFVIYASDQVYPEFIVYYKRKWG
mmetsp:Transcript_40216/g.104146  ORF Transcript_40216/g.104146 Transcript_40216/m.104146 type:complete len:159 (-) Transcript_40216:69-545(-)